jgi:hypothetical protein
MKSEQLLTYIGEINPEFVDGAQRKVITSSHSKKIIPFQLMRLTPIAACLVLVIAVSVFFANNAGWFGSKVYAIELNGETFNFYKTGAVATRDISFGVDTNGRELTAGENGLLFGGIEVASYGSFNAQDQTLLHVEGKAGNTKIILTTQGVPVTDTVIQTDRNVSEINGVPVSAGYWITNKNSNGEQNIIFLASYEQDGVTVYTECAGRFGEGDEDKVMAEIANVINTLTKNGMSYLPGIYFDTNIENQTALYIAGHSWVSLVEGNKYYLCGPVAVSFTPSGTYTVEGDVLTLFDGSEEAFKFFIRDNALVFESGEWLEHWIEPGTVFMRSESR